MLYLVFTYNSNFFSFSSDSAYSEPLNASVTPWVDLKLLILWFERFLYFWEVWKATKAKGKSHTGKKYEGTQEAEQKQELPMAME